MRRRSSTRPRRSALHVLKLDLAKARGKAGLLDKFAKMLKFPRHFGRNWDALNDCLSDLSWLNDKGWILILLRADSFAEKNKEAFHTLLDVIEGVVDYWREPNKPFGVFVQGKPREKALDITLVSPLLPASNRGGFTKRRGW